MEQMKAVLMLLQVAIATQMARSTTSVTTATGGVPRLTVVQTHGVAGSTTTAQKSDATMTFVPTAFQVVVFGIRLFGYLNYLII